MCLYCCCTVSDLILYVIAFFFPPVAVLLRSGICSSDLLLNVLLTLLGFVPGMIHAFYYITITSPLRRDAEYVYFYQQGWADNERQAGASGSRGGPQQQPPINEGYGAIQTPLLQGQTNPHVPPTGSKMEPTPAPPPYSELP